MRRRLCSLIHAVILISTLFPARQSAAEDSKPATAEPKRPLIIDTDIDVDDVMAMIYLLQRPDLDIQAVTVVGCGMARCPEACDTALNIVAFGRQPGIPVAMGGMTPSQGNTAFPDKLRDASAFIHKLPFPDNPNSPQPVDASAFLVQKLKAAPTKLTILCLGPLTNVARAFAEDPNCCKKIERIVLMGGAVRSAGNIHPVMPTDNLFAEWNIFIDPKAAAVVFAADVPITMVPLDACNHVPLTKDTLTAMSARKKSRAAEVIYSVHSSGLKDPTLGTMYFWDPVAAAALANHSVITHRQTMRIKVVDDDGPQAGRTIERENGREVDVCLRADSDRFLDEFMSTLNRH